jgi:hypothetical protein
MHHQPRDRFIIPTTIPMPKATDTAVNGLRLILASASISLLAALARSVV